MLAHPKMHFRCQACSMTKNVGKGGMIADLGVAVLELRQDRGYQVVPL